MRAELLLLLRARGLSNAGWLRYINPIRRIYLTTSNSILPFVFPFFFPH
jgi:hypothetical protein